MKPQNIIMRPKGKILQGTHDLCKFLTRNVAPADCTIVEIGSFAGEFAQVASNYFSDVWCIDPWDAKTLADMRDGRVGGSKKDYDCSDYERWWDERCGKIPHVHKLKGTSKDFVDTFDNEFLQAVYIDSIHTLEVVLEEAMLWTHKIRPGGYLCGHDFHQPMYPEVTKAVEILSHRHGIAPKTFTDTSWAIRIG